MQFLQQLQRRFTGDTRKIVLIWDGASYHRSRKVRALAKRLGFTILPLPAYSPDLNPIEGLWKWMREEVTQHYCHATLDELRRSCLAFGHTMALFNLLAQWHGFQPDAHGLVRLSIVEFSL